MKRNLLVFLLAVFSQVGLAQSSEKRLSGIDSTKSGYKTTIQLATPTNKEVEMELNDFAVRHYRYDLRYSNFWFDWKKILNKNTGLKISINYSSMFLGATAKIAEENQQTAASGIFDATLIWNFVNRNKDKNKGSLVLWTDWRHYYYGSVTPQFLGFETGSALMPAVKFSAFDYRVLVFYYQQVLFDRMAIVVGKIDMPDWFQFNGLMHPLFHFTDFAFSINPTVNWNNPGLGIAAGGYIDKQKRFALILGLNDVAGADLSVNRFFDMGLDQFAHGKFLKMAEFIYTPDRSDYYSNRISLTYWHSDELLVSDESYYTTPSSQGFSVQSTWLINERIVPIAAFGMSDGEGANALSRLNISVANAWRFPSNDLFGIGINYTTSTITDENQFLSEVFYRWTWSKTTALTPVVKLVINPALNPNVDVLFYYGIRGRISI